MNTILNKIKSNIKVCINLQKIRKERKKILDYKFEIYTLNQKLHNGRVDVDEIFNIRDRKYKSNIFRYKREIIKEKNERRKNRVL